MSRVPLMVLLVAVLMLAACSDPSPTRPQGACGLVTQEEIARALGAPVSEASSTALMQQASGQTSCTFDTQAPPGAVIVTMQRPGRPAFDEARRRTEAQPGSTLRVVPGIGEQAFTFSGAAFVLVRDTFISVGSQNDPSGFEDVALQLARLAVGRVQ